VTTFLVKRASGISSVSTFLFKRMNECGLKNSNYHVIPNIIESPVKELPTSKKNFVYILMVADLVDEIKNISGLIRAVNSLNTTIDFQVHIIGRGPDEEHLKRIAESLGLLNRKVFFEGLKTNDEVYQFLAQCDFLVMNSRYETFSLICAEAMSCGKPVLATRCGGPNEFVQEKTGILIEPGNEEELKKNLIFMLNNYKKYNPDEIKEYIRSLFSKEKVAVSFMNFYESALLSGSKK
jgi:glycosyltransferase involved in cell wall biosynthesis